MVLQYVLFFFFFNDTATTEIYTLSLHDALPISCKLFLCKAEVFQDQVARFDIHGHFSGRSEEHTSELQSQSNLVCRLLLEKKKHNYQRHSLIANCCHAYVSPAIFDTTHSRLVLP